MTTKALPDQARIVIIGSEIAGASAAWHLAQKDEKDIVVLGMGPGSTDHSSGIVQLLSPSSEVNTQMRVYSGVKFYPKFGACFTKTGHLDIASTTERMKDLARREHFAKICGLESYRISSSETRSMLPLIDERAIDGALYIPGAGIVDPNPMVRAILQAARETGAVSVYNETEVTDLNVQNGRIHGVYTTGGYIAAEIVVVAAGVWSPKIFRMAGVSIPARPVKHPNLTIRSFSELRGNVGLSYPASRDQERGTYAVIRGEDAEAGYYGHRLPIEIVDPEDILLHGQAKRGPTVYEFSQFETLRFLHGPLSKVAEYLPFFKEALSEDPQVRRRMSFYGFSGLVVVTIDEFSIIGESPVEGLWGLVRLWLAEAAGGAKILAEQIVDGFTEWDTHEVDFARFHPPEMNDGFTTKRIREISKWVYNIVHQEDQFHFGRNIRVTPVNEDEKKLGADHRQVAAWERVDHFTSNEPLIEEHPILELLRREEGSWEARHHSLISGAVHLHVRNNGVGLYPSITSFTKFDVEREGAPAYMERMCVRKMPRVGMSVYTSVLNEEGKSIADLTVQRLADNHFRVITGTGAGMIHLRWFRKNLPNDGSVTIKNMTDRLSVTGVWGLRARDLMQSITSHDMSTDAFPFMGTQEIVIDGIALRALRISFIGEPGWELYIPMATSSGRRDNRKTRKIWNILREAGQAYRAIPCGLATYLGSMRLEKRYLIEGSMGDINTKHNLYHVGFAKSQAIYPTDFTKFKNEYFNGQEAVLAQREVPPSRLLCTMMMRNTPRTLFGHCPILDPRTGKVLRDGNYRCFTTSADTAYSLSEEAGEKIVLALGFIPLEHAQIGREVDIPFEDDLLRATIVQTENVAMYDPENRFARM